MLERCVFPELNSNEGILRARACWLIGKYSNIEFKNKNNVILAA